MKKTLFILISLSFIVAACTPSSSPTVVQPELKNDEVSPVACTAEAKICPDGSAVGRVGPNCEFAACPQSKYQTIATTDVVGLSGPFTFSAQIPAGWKIEAVPNIEAINIYNPNSLGTTNLEKSQIFVRYFTANTFLTLNTVTIHHSPL